MNDRKRTPDILGEMLAGEITPAPEASPAKSAPPPARPKRAAKPRRPAASAKPTSWEYKVVTFQEHKGWRPRFVNGRELANWLSGPIIHEYLAQAGERGWILATASSGESMYGLGDRLQLYFKRQK